MNKAVRFHQTGGPEVLRLEDVEVGDPGVGEVRIRHVAVGLNFADTYFRTGLYPGPVPSGLGVEADLCGDFRVVRQAGGAKEPVHGGCPEVTLS